MRTLGACSGGELVGDVNSEVSVEVRGQVGSEVSWEVNGEVSGEGFIQLSDPRPGAQVF